MKRGEQAGFTLIELCVVVSVMSVMLPVTYLLQRSFRADALRAEHAVQSAEGMRAFSEELRADLHTLRPAREGLVLEGGCGTVRYLLDQGALVRDGGSGCGGKRALARSVTRLARTGNLMEVTFSTEEAPGRWNSLTFRLGMNQP